MMKNINFYIEKKMAPFNFTIGWDTKKGKKHFELPLGWAYVTHLNYKEHILKKVLKCNNNDVINLNNCLGLRMGIKRDDGLITIGIDIDNKNDDIKRKVFNGVKKIKELLLEHENINDIIELKTWIQKTGNNGYHILVNVTEEQYKQIKNSTGLIIDDVEYTIDVKANEKSFLVVEPSTYFDDENNEKSYKWLNKTGDIGLIPNWLFNLIKNKEKVRVNNDENDDQIVIEKTEEYINELERIKPLFKLLNKKRINEYRKYWLNLAYLIKSLYDEDGLQLLLELSRESKLYENDEWIINKYNEIEKGKFTINTFYYYLQKDKPRAYQELLKERVMEQALVKLKEINNEYLVDLNDERLQNKTLLNESINEFFTNDNIKSLNIHSPYDTAKTTLMKKIISAYKPKRVLWISYRISLTNDIKGNFKELEFKSYLDGYCYKTKKLIIQIESLLNLCDGCFDDFEVPSYDIVIIDEVESVLNQFNSPTFNGNSKDTFIFLEEIIKNSKKLITLDGDMSNRTYNYIKGFGESINIVNKVQKNKRTFNIIDDKELFEKKILNALEQNKKIVIASQSRIRADEIHNLIKNVFPKIKVMLYSSFTGDEEKMKLDDVNNIWVNFDVIIYTPTIEAGVNFDRIHFNKIFGIFSDNSTSQRSFLQMINRVRKITDDEIVLCNADSNNKTIFKLNDVKQFYNYYNAEQQAKNLKCFQKNVEYKTVNNKRIRVETYDNYSINYLYNLVEEGNKQKFYFMAKFKELVEAKGHTIKFNDTIDDETNEIENENDEIFNEIKSKFHEIVNSELVSNMVYYELMNKKKQNKASEEDKNKIVKKYYCDMLGTKEITEEELKFWYHRTHLITNYHNLVDIASYTKTNELKSNISFEKLELVKDMLNKLGLEDMDNSYISDEELKKNFDILTKENKLFTDKKTSFLFFNVRPFKKEDDEPKTNKILGYLNSIFDNYSIHITSKQKQQNGKRKRIYFVEPLNDVDKIIERKTCVN